MRPLIFIYLASPWDYTTSNTHIWPFLFNLRSRKPQSPALKGIMRNNMSVWVLILHSIDNKDSLFKSVIDVAETYRNQHPAKRFVVKQKANNKQ